MINTTYEKFMEIATKQYNQKTRAELEKQLIYFSKNNSVEVIKQLGLPQTLIFFSSTIANSNKHSIIQPSDVIEAFSFLRYISERDFVEDLLDEQNTINLGLPQAEQLAGRLSLLLKVKGDNKTKHNLDMKITRLKTFLLEQKLQQKHITRLETELRATILLFSRLKAISRLKTNLFITNQDIDESYDIARYMILKLDSTKFKILQELYSIEEPQIWLQLPKIVYDQTAHDHLNSTAYSEWENDLPESFDTLKNHINCGSRPYISAIFGYSEIFCAKKKMSRINTDDLSYILEDFETTIFGNINPTTLEDRGSNLTFTKEGIQLLKHISEWLTNLLITIFGKEEYVFNFTTSVPRHISLLLFISIVETIKNNSQKIDVAHILLAVKKWVNLLTRLQVRES